MWPVPPCGRRRWPRHGPSIRPCLPAPTFCTRPSTPASESCTSWADATKDLPCAPRCSPSAVRRPNCPEAPWSWGCTSGPPGFPMKAGVPRLPTVAGSSPAASCTRIAGRRTPPTNRAARYAGWDYGRAWAGPVRAVTMPPPRASSRCCSRRSTPAAARPDHRTRGDLHLHRNLPQPQRAPEASGLGVPHPAGDPTATRAATHLRSANTSVRHHGELPLPLVNQCCVHICSARTHGAGATSQAIPGQVEAVVKDKVQPIA